ncbi:MAG: citramalate synthase [Clostridia bacterium]
MKIEVLDTTLRDGAQAEGISYSVSDKLSIAKVLDNIGVDIIEAVNPIATPKDVELCEKLSKVTFQNSRLCVFGSTRRKDKKVNEDKNIKAIIDSNIKTASIFGKSSVFQAEKVLLVSKKENLEIIFDTISYLTENGIDVLFDAEHFFDGYKENSEYALEVLTVAKNAGAKTLVLCDTNGGSFPDEIYSITKDVVDKIKAKIGIHCHNDMGFATGNTYMAVIAGATHIQGTFTGFGERCGNAALSSLIPALEIKKDYELIPKDKLKLLTSSAREIAEISNIILSNNKPFVGHSAFTHKAGMHLDGVYKDKSSFEHIDPAKIGNSSRFLISELSGKSALIMKLKSFCSKDEIKNIDISVLLDKIKKLEQKGYSFESAGGSFELIVYKELGNFVPSFKLEKFKLISFLDADNLSKTEVTMNIMVGNAHKTSVAVGEGPVHALDNALRAALIDFYPELSALSLSDYKVRVLEGKATTSSRVRVLIESTDGKNVWNTIGVSNDIIKASFIALVDAIELKLLNIN